MPVQRWASLNPATLEVRTPKRWLVFIPIQMQIVAFIGTGGAGCLGKPRFLVPCFFTQKALDDLDHGLDVKQEDAKGRPGFVRSSSIYKDMSP